MLSRYGTHAGLQEYASDRGVTLASDDTALQDKALVRASMALDSAYEYRFSGSRTSNTQSLSWPRTDATWSDGTTISGTPVQVEWATYELAIAELADPGVLSPVVVPGKVKTRARVEGAVDVSYARAESDPVGSMIPVYTTVEGILLPLLGGRAVVPGVLVV